MGENVIQVNSGITINIDVSVKNAMYMKKIMFGILLHLNEKMASIMNDSVIMCDEVTQSYYEETKTVSANFNEKI